LNDMPSIEEAAKAFITASDGIENEGKREK
jgi:hypothetical protein